MNMNLRQNPTHKFWQYHRADGMRSQEFDDIETAEQWREEGMLRFHKGGRGYKNPTMLYVNGPDLPETVVRARQDGGFEVRTVEIDPRDPLRTMVAAYTRLDRLHAAYGDDPVRMRAALEEYFDVVGAVMADADDAIKS